MSLALAGCGPEGADSGGADVTRVESALTMSTFTLPLFVGQNPSDPVIAASSMVSINDGAHTQEVGSVNDRAMISNLGVGVGAGNVGTTVGAGADCGTVLSAPRVFLRSNSTVAGSLYQGSTTAPLSQTPSTVLGITKTGIRFTADTTWTRTVTWPTTFNQTPNLEPGQQPATVPLAPAAYHNVDVKSGRTLRLSAGQYFLDSLIVESGAGLQIDGSAGPVFVFILASGITFRGTMVPGVNTPGMLFPSFTVMTTGSAVLTTPFTGVVIAPNGSIDLGGSATQVFSHRGAYFGKSVTLFEKARLFHYRDTFSFRNFGPSDGTPFIGERVAVTGGSLRLNGADVTDEALQSETEVAVSRNGGNFVVTVGYNDFTTTPTNPRIVYTDPIPDPRDGFGRLQKEGTTLMGWSFSTDGGHTFRYGGHVSPPPGWSIIWGDPAMAKLNIDDSNVYYAEISGTTAAFRAAWDPNQQAIVNGNNLLAALNGYCISRSTDRGITFTSIACTDDVFQDGTSLAVATGASGGREVYVAGTNTRVFRMDGETMTFAPSPNNPLANPFPPNGLGSHPRMKVFGGVLYVLGMIGNSVVANRLNAAASANTWLGQTTLATQVSHNNVTLANGVIPTYEDGFSYEFGVNQAGLTTFRMIYAVDDPGFGIGFKTLECAPDLTGCQSLGWSTTGQAGDEFQPSLRFGGGRWVAMWRKHPLGSSLVSFMAGEMDLVSGSPVLTERTLSFGVQPCFYGDSTFARWGDYEHMGSFGDGRFFAAYTTNGPGCRFQGGFIADQHVGGSLFGF
ncbi:MAG: hypothetical protein ABJA82_03895 [Myxococcales bacterium]